MSIAKRLGRIALVTAIVLAAALLKFGLPASMTDASAAEASRLDQQHARAERGRAARRSDATAASAHDQVVERARRDHVTSSGAGVRSERRTRLAARSSRSMIARPTPEGLTLSIST